MKKVFFLILFVSVMMACHKDRDCVCTMDSTFVEKRDTIEKSYDKTTVSVNTVGGRSKKERRKYCSAGNVTGATSSYLNEDSIASTKTTRIRCVVK